MRVRVEFCIATAKVSLTRVGQRTFALSLISNINIMNEEYIQLTENILSIFKKKYAGQPVEEKELENVIRRFRELVNAPRA